MTLVLMLILLPFAAGAGLLLVRSESMRRVVVVGTTVIAGGGTLMLTGLPLNLDNSVLHEAWANGAMLVLELVMGLYILVVGVRTRSPMVIALTVAQMGVVLWLELNAGSHGAASRPLFVDKFSVMMALINGLVGGGICIYALGYMREYHERAHSDVADRRPLFFALLLTFMGAMFGLVFANNLMWLFFFWEVTTLCSFLLIGYTQTEEARRNALRALVMNMGGGLGFALAMLWCQQKAGILELQALIACNPATVLLPAALLCLAGITKSAQLPFSSWLLGAMVAPTPVSALLHSSTMVKAGVYLVLRMAPVITGTKVGLMVALVGAVTFLVGSLAAITVERRQTRARPVDHCQSWLNRALRRHWHTSGGLGRGLVDPVSCAGQVPALPLRGGRGTPVA